MISLVEKRRRERRFTFYTPRDRVVGMSVRMRHTRGHTGNRRSHHALKATTTVVDKESGNVRLPHRLDEATGMYRGKQIAPAREVRVALPKVKAAHIHEHTHEHAHEHAHETHANAEVKAAAALEKPQHSEAKKEAKGE